jgi:hypothetical protein
MNPKGLTMFPTTQEKPISRFFSWVAKDNKEGSSSSSRFLCFFLELQKTTISGEARHCLLQCKKINKREGQGVFIVVFYHGFIRRGKDDNERCIHCHLLPRIIKDENKCNTHNCLFCKGTRMKRKQINK